MIVSPSVTDAPSTTVLLIATVSSADLVSSPEAESSVDRVPPDAPESSPDRVRSNG